MKQAIGRAVTKQALVGACLVVLVSPAVSQQPPGGLPGGGMSAGPTEVGVITLNKTSVPVTLELPGRVLASQTADVRPQVGGIVKAITFQPGQQVKAGDVLFELDDATYQAQLAVQQATLQKAQVAEASAQAKVDRYQQLAANSVSQSDLLEAQAALAQAKADVASAQANVRSAELNVSLVKVTAPISGVISEASVTQGGLVTAAQATALATIRTLDPAFVDMVDTSANLLKMRTQARSAAGPAIDSPPASATIRLELENGEQYPQSGTISSPDVVVSESTGSFTVRATFQNPERTLLPGMFVRALVDLGVTQQGYLVPQRAVSFDSSGRATALFAEDGKAVSHVLTTSGNSGNNWVVTAGISDGAQVIIDGLQKIRSGADVSPIVVSLDKNGVVSAPEQTQGPPAGSSANTNSLPPAPATSGPSSDSAASRASAAPSGASPTQGG